MNERHEQEGKLDLTREKKINLGRKSIRQGVQRKRKVFRGGEGSESIERDRRKMRKSR